MSGVEQTDCQFVPGSECVSISSGLVYKLTLMVLPWRNSKLCLIHFPPSPPTLPPPTVSSRPTRTTAPQWVTRRWPSLSEAGRPTSTVPRPPSSPSRGACSTATTTPSQGCASSLPARCAVRTCNNYYALCMCSYKIFACCKIVHVHVCKQSV